MLDDKALKEKCDRYVKKIIAGQRADASDASRRDDLPNRMVSRVGDEDR